MFFYYLMCYSIFLFIRKNKNNIEKIYIEMIYVKIMKVYRILNFHFVSQHTIFT